MNQGIASKIFDRVFWALSSLKLAVMVILSLAVSLGVGTFLESLYDTPTAQYWIYRSWWFHGIFVLLGLNILCVAISRYPWKWKHTAFLMAHVGILTLLAGSLLTDQRGIDGNLRISEGEMGSIVELDSAALVIGEQDKVHSIPIRWLPSNVKFTPFSLFSYGLPYDLKVDQFLSHADSTVSFIPNPEFQVTPSEDNKLAAALRFRITGGPMRITQEMWLWEGAPGWRTIQAGPARFSLGKENSPEESKPHQPWLAMQIEKDGSLSYVAHSSLGKVVRGSFRKDHIIGQVIHPGWKGDVKITLEEVLPHAMPLTQYKPARVQFGSQAPSSAIHVVAGQSADVWLGLGDRAVLHLDGRDVEIGYFPKRLVLPFSLRLERFTVDHDQGTLNPAAYSSRVTVLDGQGQKEANISMNEPLELHGYTVYQASYEEGEPRPVTSIFAVNRDPGRLWKYLGSLFIVMGSVLLFGQKYKRKNKKTLAKKSVASQSLVRKGSASEVLAL